MLRIAEYRNVLGEDGKSVRRERIDLKELEKFGFIQYIIRRKIEYELKKKIGSQEIYNIKIDENRIIHFNHLSVDNELPNVLYDLIRADLVEKVEE